MLRAAGVDIGDEEDLRYVCVCLCDCNTVIITCAIIRFHMLVSCDYMLVSCDYMCTA